MQNKNVDIADLGCKVSAILNHHDKFIREHSLKFLQPVFLYALCNPNSEACAKSLWFHILTRKTDSNDILEFLFEIFQWNKISKDSCQNTAQLLIEALEYAIKQEKREAALDFGVYLMAVISSLIENGYDPCPALNTIHDCMQKHNFFVMNIEFMDYALVSIAQILHKISPFYLEYALPIVKLLINNDYSGNIVTRYMIFDALTTRCAIDGKQLSAAAMKNIESIMKQINQSNSSDLASPANQQHKAFRRVLHYHPMVAINLNLVRLSYLMSDDSSSFHLKSIKSIANFAQHSQPYSNVLNQFLRAILLSSEQKPKFSDKWHDILQLIVGRAAVDKDFASNTIYFILSCLTKEKDGKRQKSLLYGLASFASVNENVPLILNTYKALSTSQSLPLQLLAIELHTRLWKVENRTYQILHKCVTEEYSPSSKKSSRCEISIAKAHAIRQICAEQDARHGLDFIAELSKIMNDSSEVAIALALDTIMTLCSNHIINIHSTWKVLRNSFESASQPRIVEKLCRFFGEVAVLSTREYPLYHEALQKLWTYITDPNSAGSAEFALRAMRHFNFFELDLKSIPQIFYEGVEFPKVFRRQIQEAEKEGNTLTYADIVPYISGECWLELLKKINPAARLEAIGFVRHLIQTEISQFRSVVYMLPDGKPEPADLDKLNDASPLRAIIKFLKTRANQNEYSPLIKDCLECLLKLHNAPIPPLNWQFAKKYLLQTEPFDGVDLDDLFLMKKHTLSIISSQVHSPSSRQIVDDYVESCEAHDESEILLVLELAPQIFANINLTVLQDFITKALDFLHERSASENYKANCSLEQAFQHIARVFDNKCLTKETTDLLIAEMKRFNDLSADLPIYHKYIDLVTKFPSEVINDLSVIDDCAMINYKKSFIIRTNAVRSQKPFPSNANKWNWLNALIDNAATDEERQSILFEELFNLLQTNHTEDGFRHWMTQIPGKILSELADETNAENIQKLMLYFDVFVVSAIIVSGCSLFVGDERNVPNQLDLKLFPESLWVLGTCDKWAEYMPKVYEFLYHLYTKQSILPDQYKSLLLESLTCVKNHSYFLEKTNWIKFTSLKIESTTATSK